MDKTCPIHCAVTITDAGSSNSIGDLGKKLIPKSNTTDNTIKMISALVLFMVVTPPLRNLIK